MRKAGCVNQLDQALIHEILRILLTNRCHSRIYHSARFKLRLVADEKVMRKGVT